MEGTPEEAHQFLSLKNMDTMKKSETTIATTANEIMRKVTKEEL